MAGSPSLDNLDDDPPSPVRPGLIQAPASPATRGDIERLYHSHCGKLVRFFKRCGQSEALAQDLAQESFVQALRHLPQFDGRAQLSTWVWAIARNLLLAHLRKQGRRVERVTDETGEPVELDALTSEPSGRLTDLQDCVRRGFAAFAQQHPERAQVLYLAAVEGWTREELAQFLGRTPHATSEYLSQCRAKLRPFLADCDDAA